MTLILTLLNSEHSVLVADRRLTANGAVTTDEQTKLTALTCADARLGVAFTGLAEVGRFRTEEWILTSLSEAGAPDYAARSLLPRFEKALNERWPKIKVSDPLDKRLSIVFAGYLHDEDPPRAHTWRLSNWEGANEIWTGDPLVPFRLTGSHEKRPAETGLEPAIVQIAGMLGVIPQADIEAMRGLLERRASPKALVERAVGAVRQAADRPESHGTIGKQCLSLVIPRDAAARHWSTYHPNGNSDVVYFANEVIATPDTQIAIMQPEIRVEAGGRPMLFGKVGRNAPCPCGSGKKYKRCHG